MNKDEQVCKEKNYTRQRMKSTAQQKWANFKDKKKRKSNHYGSSKGKVLEYIKEQMIEDSKEGEDTPMM